VRNELRIVDSVLTHFAWADAAGRPTKRGQSTVPENNLVLAAAADDVVKANGNQAVLDGFEVVESLAADVPMAGLVAEPKIARLIFSGSLSKN